MNATDRTKAPQIKQVEKLKLENPDFIKLKNGIPAWFINAGKQDIVKIDLLFNAGTYFQSRPLQALLTSKMLSEGTAGYDAYRIAEKFDFYGAQFLANCEKDKAGLTLLSLNKHLEKVLPVFSEIIFRPVFPESEWNILKRKHKQNFLINNRKVKHLARRHFFPLIFNGHPYGSLTREENYDSIILNDLKTFYETFYNPANAVLIISGKIEDHIPELIDKHIGINKENNLNEPVTRIDHFTYQANKKFIEQENALQSAIRIGKPLFNKKHPDYIKMKILTTALGGYFGSRLMNNIREDKGYTYGIGAGLISLQQAGYFFIATEVGSNVRNNALDEIYREVEKLCNENISEEELFKVKNFLIGNIIHSLDGPVGLAENFKSLITYGYNFEYINNLIDTINTTTAVELKELAGKYMQPDSLSELVAGQ
ncbi:MAG: insulinase family protein [Bacteroidales bacterium]|nr:insulinase family protein [Bacteroidales bacterium]MCF8344701.1 insulinase family protein [Bacteroidales bacterium]MCF8350304.1 insulinase family protein [Bacteroidales bacterium]MCF8374743.1 insulinase family protein [Bacteroidales bacterium]MCF8399853.1 insulinase family protein [Bacteroidales bacterium]